MKLLMENWKLYLTEDASIAKQNANKLMHLLEEENSSESQKHYKIIKILEICNIRESSYDRTDPTATFAAAKEKLAELFEKIPSLATENMKSLLGVGTQGVVFGMDNDRALKLYSNSYVSGQEDFYDQESTKIFTGNSKAQTLPIFDRGEVQSEEGPVYYAEMAKIIVFTDYLKLTGREPYVADEMFMLIGIYGNLINEGKTFEEAYEIVKSQGYNISQDFERNTKENLTKQEHRAAYDMTAYMLENYGMEYLGDAHAGNFGVLYHTIGRANLAFVLFDP